ncbi:MAG: hypothetical protein ACRDQ5_06325, partial [Sciscionella sp.]
MTSILGRQSAGPGGAASGPARRDISLDAGWRFAGPLTDPSAGYAGSFVEVDLPHSVATLSW